jgi:regulator of nucleoside diphosphate kinase
MQKMKTSLILTRDDYQMINNILNSWGQTSFDKKQALDLKAELRKAKVVAEKDLPGDVVRINSLVKVKADDQEKIMELVLVTPDKANLKEGRISVLAPVGTALLGFRKGQRIAWQVPSGKKTFTIIDVSNDEVDLN